MTFKRVFVYGTLKAGFPNHALNRGRRLPGEFVTADAYPLYLVGERCSPWLLNLPGEGTQVEGELYELDDEALAGMDELERIAVSTGYQRRVLEVIERLHGKRLTAFVYMKTAAQFAQAKLMQGPLMCYEKQHAEHYSPREAG